MKKLIAIVAVTMAVLATLITGPSPASAHYDYAYHGKDITTVSDYHWVVTVCDQEADGHVVVGEYKFEDGSRQSAWDTNGSKAGCGSGTLIQPAVEFRLCEEDKGCTKWEAT
jgi:hypothetical protein